MKYLLLVSFLSAFSSCDLFNNEQASIDNTKPVDQDLMDSFNDYGLMFAVADAFRVSKADFEKACNADASLSPYCDEVTKGIKEGSCILKNDVRDTFSYFRVTTLTDTAKPKDEQEKCPLYLDANAEKTVPTAGKDLWERTVDLRFESKKNPMKHGKGLKYTITSEKNPKTATTSLEYTVKGTMNFDRPTFSGKGSFSQTTDPAVFDFSAEIIAKKFGKEATLKIKSSISFVPSLVIRNEHYELDGKDISSSELAKAGPAFHTMFLWGWPNEGPRI